MVTRPADGSAIASQLERAMKVAPRELAATQLQARTDSTACQDNQLDGARTAVVIVAGEEDSEDAQREGRTHINPPEHADIGTPRSISF